MTARGGGWEAATASVRGASHERTGKPNQDAVRVVEVGGGVGGLVAAVCDGHGGERYVRSDVGSRLGVEVACAVGRHLLGSTIAPDEVEARIRSFVVTEIVDRWRKRVLDDVAARPFADEEHARAGAALDTDPLVSYGATLLLAICAPDWVGFVQIGDGDITVVAGTDATAPVPHDDRLVGGETTSLCLPTAVADARIAVCAGRLPDLVILSSDGYANSFASPTWRSDVGRDLLDLVGRRGIDGVESQLPEWLADSAAAAGDDVSMALVHRAASSFVPPPPATTGSVATTASRRPLRTAAYAGCGAAIVGLTAGFLVGRASGDDGARAVETSPAASAVAISTVVTAVTDALPPTSTDIEVVPSTTLPVDPAVGIVELTDADQVVLFTGGDAPGGVVLAFDPMSASEPRPRLIGWVDVESRDVELPARWEFDDGRLSFSGSPRAEVFAVAAPLFSPYVWAIAPDQRTLTAYDAGTGQQARSVIIVDADGDELPAATPSASPSTSPSPSATPSPSASTSNVPATSVPISQDGPATSGVAPSSTSEGGT